MTKVSKKAPVVEEVAVEVPVMDTPEPAKKPAKAKKKTGKVFNCSLLNVRESATTSSKIVDTLNPDAVVEILGEEGNFYKINKGFVMKDYIEV